MFEYENAYQIRDAVHEPDKILICGSDDFYNPALFNAVLDNYLVRYVRQSFSLLSSVSPEFARASASKHVTLCHIGGMEGVSQMVRDFAYRQNYRSWRIGSAARSFDNKELQEMHYEISRDVKQILLICHPRKKCDSWIKDLCKDFVTDTFYITSDNKLKMIASRCKSGTVDIHDPSFDGIL